MQAKYKQLSMVVKPEYVYKAEMISRKMRKKSEKSQDPRKQFQEN